MNNHLVRPALVCLLAAVILLLTTSRSRSAQEKDGSYRLEDYPAQETMRPITLGHHIWEADLYIESLSTDRAWNKDGEEEETYGSYNLFNSALALRYGLSRSWEFSVAVPYITGEIGETTGGSIGDVRGGMTYELFFGPHNSISIGSEFSFPSGLSDYHYEIMGDEVRLQNFRTGDPGYNAYPALAYRYRSDNLSFRLRATGVFTGSGEIRFNKIKGFEEEVDMDPGDGYRLRGGFYYQINKQWAGGLFSRYNNISATDVDDESLEDENELWEAQSFVVYQPNRRLDVFMGVGVPLAGKNSPIAYPVLLEVRSRF